MNPQTTICAISTAPGTGGIAVARISGPQSLEIAGKVWKGKKLGMMPSHTAHLGEIADPDSGEILDTALATIFRAPRSFTGEDVVELSIHGSQWIQRELINLLIRQGAHMAERGEFTRRAVINGKLDMAEAEAVADMIASSSRAAQRIAMSHLRGHYSRKLNQLRDKLIELSSLVELELDFSEEDVQFANRAQLLDLAQEIHTQVSTLANSFAAGRAIKNGIPIAIVGATNAGKSTLLNRLIGEDKAIVSDIHGTTRDIVEDTVEINGTLYRFIDTAGLRQTNDPIETIGIRRAIQSAESAAVILWVIDPADTSRIEETWQTISKDAAAPIVAVINKADTHIKPPRLPDAITETIIISALHDSDLTPLLNVIARLAAPADIAPELTVTNARHYQALTNAGQSIRRAIEALRANLPGDLLAQDLRETASHLAAITTPVTTPDLLTRIFSTFCIGK